MDWGWIVSVAGFGFATSMTPGPNNTMLTASGANYGFRRTIPHMLGVSIGFPVMLLAIGLFGSAVMNDPTVHLGLKVAGTAYLLWLAWKIARADPTPAAERQSALAGSAAAGRPFTFLQAAAFQWVNPKAIMTGASALAAFSVARPGMSPMAPVFATVAILTVTTVCSVVTWTLVGMGAARFLTTRRAMRTFNLCMAALLVVSLGLSLA